MKNIHPRQSHNLILDLEWNPFSDAVIPAKEFLILIDFFGDQNSFQIVAADQIKEPVNRPIIFNKQLCHRPTRLFL